MTKRYWRRLGWVGLLAGAVGGVALAALPPGGNNEPNCPPCQYWNGTECVPRTLVAWAEAQEDSGRTVYKVAAQATPAEGTITYSVVPRNGVLGGGVELDGTVTPDLGASVVTVLVTLSMGSSACVSFPVDVPAGECDSCGDCSPGEASASLDSGRMQYTVKTGGAAFGKGPALRLSPPALDATAGQPTPRNLSILRKPGTEVIPDAVTKGVRQVLTAQALVDVVTVNSASYEMRFYKAADKGSKDGSGLYVPTASAYLTHTVEYVAGSAPILRVTRTEGGVSRVVEFEQSGSTLKLRRGGMGSPVIWADQTERASVHLGGGITNVTVTMKNVAGVVTSTMVETNQAFAWGAAIIGRVEDPDGSCPVRTTYSYYTTQGQAGYGQLKAMTRSDGYWVAYQYDSQGRETLRAEAWNDVAYDPQATVSALAAAAKGTWSDYTAVDSNDSLFYSPRHPRTVEVKVAGVTVAKTYYAFVSGQLGRVEIEERCASATVAYGAAANLRTERWYSYAHPDRLVKLIQPDGVEQSIEYQTGTYAGNGTQPGTFTPGTGDYLCRITTNATTANPTGTPGKTTREVAVLNPWGGVLLAETHARTESDYERIAWQVFDLDDSGHELHRYTHNGEQVDSQWSGCCGLDTQTGPTGTVTSYATRDGLGRPLTVVKLGVAASAPYPAQGDITTTYEYNAAGQVTREEVSGGGLTLVSTNGFDLAGRPTRSRNPAGLETAWSYSNGGRTTTVTRPGGATEITDTYLDGRIKSLTGSGTVARYHTYGVNSDGTTWTKVYTGPAGSSSPMWETTTFDLLGRTINSTRPKFGSGTEVTANEYYEDTDPASGRLKGHLKRTTRAGLAAHPRSAQYNCPRKKQILISWRRTLAKRRWFGAT